MKKLISTFITMAIILSVSACGGSTPEATTTTASIDNSVSTTANADEKAETTAEETAAAEEITTAEITTAEVTSAVEGELFENNFLDGLKDKSPLYYEFGKITSTVPVTLTMTLLNEDGSEMGTMKMTMASLSRMSMVTEAEGESARIILDDGTNYIISDDEKYVMYYTLTGEEKTAMEEEMINSMQLHSAFDFDKAEFSSGTEEFMGESLKYEAVDDGTTQATIYFDPETGRAKYMASDGQTARIDDYYTGADESLFEIPEGYEMIDFEALIVEASATE